jgi:hypothetical protein
MLQKITNKLQILLKNKLRYFFSIALYVLTKLPILYIPIRNLARVVAPTLYSRFYLLMTSGLAPRYQVSALGARARKIYHLQKHLSVSRRTQ